MPYRRAPLWLALLVPSIVIAFWPRYFGQFREAPFALHAHGLTASAWILLALAQSWTGTRRRIALHRLVGRGVFVVVPAFSAGGLLAMHSLAGLAASGGDPFHTTFGMQLAMDDLFALVIFLVLAWMALAARRQTSVHAAAMLSTILLVLSPVTARLLQLLPLPVDDPFTFAFHVTQTGATIVALWLGRRGGREGLPFRITAGAIVAQMILFETLGRSEAWARLATWLSGAPATWVAVIGIVVGLAVCWSGWRSGRRPAQPSSTRVAAPPTAANSAGSVPVIHT